MRKYAKELAELREFTGTMCDDKFLVDVLVAQLFNLQNTMTLLADLPGITTALDYIKTFNEKLSTLTEIRNHKFHNFVITKDNFDIFYRTKGLDEYLKFFEKNYPAEIQ